MKIVMLKGGLYEIQENDGTLVHTIWSRKISLGGRGQTSLFRTPWRKTPLPESKDPYIKHQGDFDSLTKLLEHLDYTYINYPGPNQLLKKVKRKENE